MPQPRRFCPYSSSMSPVATAPVEAPPAPPPRPGYLSVVWATFIGYLWTVILSLPLLLAAWLVGLDVIDTSGSIGRGVFYRYDAWSWAAEACVGLIAVGATALMVGHQLRTRTGWEVSFGETFLILLLAGYAPVLALTPLYGAAAIVSLGLAAFVLRWRAAPSGAEPSTVLGQVPHRFRRRIAVAAAVGVPLMAAYVLGYAATHPLRFDVQVSHKRAYEREPGAIERYTFGIRDVGSAAVTDLAIVRSEGSPGLQLDRAGVLAGVWRPGERPPLRPLEELAPGSFPDRITLGLRQGASCPALRGTLDAVWIRYTVLGMRHEQRIPLVDGPSVRCR
jgi:hypothetical protein